MAEYRKVNSKVISNLQCQQYFASGGIELNDKFICTSSTNGSICQV
jgi:hypothetical protein